jgi:hypothetical protein
MNGTGLRLRYYVQDKCTKETQASAMFLVTRDIVDSVLEMRWQQVKSFNVRCLILIEGGKDV